ncbi:nitronate monooxygenase [Deinococcus aestuarii]|uniref:nitronate monooxygenase n=1 Tax=Deinococcus aestuarii TaxID=2774531 RepID=UPI001FEB0CFF|nr:nitronate monooxygenase [Deinococcus aestuarii]
MTTLPQSTTTTLPSPPAPLPRVIQGGMGVAISNWVLAQAVSRAGQLGVVSGTGIDNLLVRRLQDGDPGGHVRRALAHFPDQTRAQKAVRDYWLEEGRAPGQPYKRVPLPTVTKHRVAWELSLLGSFVEVFLARGGHANPVGLNLLTKLQLHNLPALYGAMLAGVDTVIMGAGIPREIPGVLDAFAQGKPGTARLDVKGEGPGASVPLTFDPSEFGFGGVSLPRPNFYPIISSHVLAGILTRKATGSVQGFVIEGPTAGGHNAPPRGQVSYDESGQPVYTERDIADLEEMRRLGLPFWLAGGSGSPNALQAALDQGAAGIQVGTLFAYCRESGLRPETREHTLGAVRAGGVSVYTDPLASPTGFPFKVVQLPGTLSEPERYAARTRVCDIGYLREAYWDGDKTGLRCAAEPVETYVQKGGKPEDTVGRKCLCNALMADAGHAQIQKGGEVEQPLLTSGDDLVKLGGWTPGYTAGDVLDYLLGKPGAGPRQAGAGEVLAQA